MFPVAQTEVSQQRRALLGLIGWALAPACTQLPVTQYTTDAVSSWLLWGFEQGHSCAFRAASGAALSQYDIAITCTTQAAIDRAVPDANGRKWSWENGHSCAVKAASAPSTVSLSPSSSQPAASQQQPASPTASTASTWDAAPTCTGTVPVNAVKDSSGRCGDMPFGIARCTHMRASACMAPGCLQI